MPWIWTGFITISLFCALLTGQIPQLAAAVTEGADRGVRLAISLAGPLCLWSGLNRLMVQIGWMDRVAVLLRPVLRRLFPAAWSHPEIRQALCANVSANLLGLGSAATPSGIDAAKRMAAGRETAGDELCRLVVMNTASVQLIPFTVAAVRAGAGAGSPFDLLPAVWVTSLCSVTAGLLAAKGLSKWI